MRALARIRTLAAICALLSFLTANVLAGVPGRPIDRPEGPPDPSTEIGEPDPGHSGMPHYIRQILVAAGLSHPALRWLFVGRLQGHSRQVKPQFRAGRVASK